MDSGKQRNMNKERIYIINDMQKRIFETQKMIDNLDKNINHILIRQSNEQQLKWKAEDTSEDSLYEMRKRRAFYRKWINYRINYIRQIEKTLVIC